MEKLKKILSTTLLAASISGLALSGVGVIKNNQYMIDIGIGTALISSTISVEISRTYETFRKIYRQKLLKTINK